MTGSIVRASNSGLGILAWEFYRNGVVDKVVIAPNGVYRDFPKRFPNNRVGLDEKNIEWLLSDIDTLLIFETPFQWEIIPRARKKGIKTVFMPMHEGFPETPPYNPDLYIMTSDLDMDLPVWPKERINVPVAKDRIKHRERMRAEVFVHNAGHGGIQGRNGTQELLEAMKFVKSPIKLIIRTQSAELKSDDPRVEIRRTNLANYWDLWKEGDVFVFPEKFNGLSLPIQEAFASGMMIMSSDRYPFNTWLPKDALIPIDGEFETRILRRVKQARISPEKIAEKIDYWYNKDISKYSILGKKWGIKNSWAKLKPKYIELLSA